ncbi:hypothetical protein MBOL_37550 [Mycobacteroides abscessus subsp. bolletii BD]|uniref:Uncharacterized protein n=2 Tax=Mycobacteroides abscessus TaxID=36809 RepID=A0A829QJ73_9MYCO|nr:hypothetical protein MBOL_37550 [Mycobacteroides abscessus subsp. bolletii BD]EIT89968.1 hypothetical protein MA4S0303_3771 [Mycobacteroides abscessus 4S-0303]EIT91962.1 hypothetical protein MA4S0726RB_3296 [Mycobacteroides abscessus 4S-0726-RB]EIT95511.1 hypothetical protein MA4S0726RA_3706 [Mycobacteroides abscessus 4S-0726-RA]EIU36663.1 hypothetical protein MA6G0125S_4111 [Mycobacteroides abscessus 6G-0125-S]EIU39311.1 hypothetical protein MA6G0125R_3071 [Mycobacteroides abscessus 6G-012
MMTTGHPRMSTALLDLAVKLRRFRTRAGDHTLFEPSRTSQNK